MKTHLLPFFTLLLLLSGCRNVDYIGQKFDPTPMSEPLTYYTKRSEVPEDQYTIIGRFTISAPTDFNEYELEALLLEKGREYGGNAVCLIDWKIIELGTYKTNDAEFGAPKTSGSTGIDPTRNSIRQDAFGNPAPLRGEVRRRAEIRARALLFKDRKTTQKLLEEQ